ncbi:hypothetical protein V6N13_138409 [Hibiscus sabdariffa]|uniref:Uncharacterized protein n=1 Tax=Hibiscus sabdariffa TaxID=183260 RepID=A0ABR2QD91_9ROSI
MIDYGQSINKNAEREREDEQVLAVYHFRTLSQTMLVKEQLEFWKSNTLGLWFRHCISSPLTCQRNGGIVLLCYLFSLLLYTTRYPIELDCSMGMGSKGSIPLQDHGHGSSNPASATPPKA